MIQAYHAKLAGQSVGIVFGSFAPLHQGHLDLIIRAKKENEGGCIVVVCGAKGDKGEPSMPLAKRYRYVREFFAGDAFVVPICINDTELGIDAYPYGWSKWLAEFNKLWNGYVENPFHTQKAWYVGDECYYNDLKSFNERVVRVDRQLNPICATMIRKDPIGNWDRIATPFRRIFSTNILVAGTASEGKTTLVQDLGRYFNAPYSHEWARDYIRESCIGDWEFDSADFIAFLEGQFNLNKSLINSPGNHGVFFSDTDSFVTKMYAAYYAKDPLFALTQNEFEKIAVIADELASKSRWDRIYLVGPKGKFVDDHERYMAHSDMDSRNKMFDLLCEYYKAAGEWDKVVILNGSYYENFITVSNYVQSIIKYGKGE